MSTIQPNELKDAIMEVLKEYEGVTESAAVKGAYITAVHAENKLHQAKPPGSGRYGSWADYNASWKVSQETRRGKAKMVVHNAKYYNLTHLLENGHALWQGGRAEAFPHIAPVAEEAEEELLDNIKSFLEN